MAVTLSFFISAGKNIEQWKMMTDDNDQKQRW